MIQFDLIRNTDPEVSAAMEPRSPITNFGDDIYFINGG